MRIVLLSVCLLLLAPAAFAKKSVKNPLDDLAEKAETAEELMRVGNLNLEANRDHEAKRLFKLAEIKLRNPAEARLGLAEIRIQNSDLRRAKYGCRKMERDFPKSPLGAICFGRMWLKFDRSARALENFEAVRQTGDVRAIVGLARTYDYMNEWDKSVELYKVAIEKGAGYDAWLGLALVRERKGEMKDALKAAQKAVDLESHSAFALYHLGRMMQKGKDAAALVEKALLIRPNWADAYGTLGEIWISDDPARAVDAFRKAIALEKDRGTFHIGLGTALFHLKKNEDARVELNKALELVPNHIEATRMLSQVELGAGNTERAIQLAETAVQLSPNNAEICFETAYLFFKIKRFTQANAYFIRTLSMTPDNTAAKVYMGDIACDRRMYSDGVSHYKEALKGDMKGFSKSDITSRIQKCSGRK